MALASAASFVPFRLAVGATKVPQHKLHLSHVMDVCYQDVLKEMRQGKPFVSLELNQAVADKRLTLCALGAHVEYEGRPYDVDQLTIPLVWNAKDNHLLRERDLVYMAARLYENGINSHDFMLEGLLETHDLIVSKQYCYSMGSTLALASGGYAKMLYTAFSKIPKRGL